MNNYNYCLNTQKPKKLKIRLLCKFSFWVLFFFSLSANFAIAQPDSFTISGCPGVNGDYTRSIHDIGGCPCYERVGVVGYVKPDPMNVNLNGTRWGFSPYHDCTSTAVSQVVYQMGSTPCDITTATALVCDPATSLAVTTNGRGVPTLSEWGLIVLALLFMTAGTLYLVQPMVVEKEA